MSWLNDDVTSADATANTLKSVKRKTEFKWQNAFPEHSEGSEGETRNVYYNGRPFSCVKMNGKWHFTALNTIGDINSYISATGELTGSGFDLPTAPQEIQRPDYNSGWLWFIGHESDVQGQNTSWYHQHSLGQLPLLYQIQVAPVGGAPGGGGNPTTGMINVGNAELIADQQSIVWFTQMSNVHTKDDGIVNRHGISHGIDATGLYLNRGGGAGGANGNDGGTSGYIGGFTTQGTPGSNFFNNCFIRYLLWT